jgi:hypothetical protein
MKIPRKPMRKPGEIRGETRQGILEFPIICFGKIPWLASSIQCSVFRRDGA